LRPKKSRSGHRTYTREDIDLILLIKQLLHEEGFTTAGAIRQLEKRAEAGDGDNGGPAERTRIVGELQEIKDLLQNVLTRTSRNG
jgi:DNA-binding transcriptional MerR regulator